jgi:hypothetical protein
VKISQPSDAVSAVNSLARELELLHENIVLRSIEYEAVEGILLQCSNDYLDLVKFGRNLQLKQGVTEEEKEFQNHLEIVNTNLQALREALGQLIEVLDIRENLSGSMRLPEDFENRHGIAESAIQTALLAIAILLDDYVDPTGSQESSHSGVGEPGSADNVDGKREYWKIPRDLEMRNSWSNFG